MQIGKIVEGMQIIARHVPADAYCMQAEHDQIWCGAYDLPLTEDEKKRMEDLGWFEAEDSWSAFV
jgi:hypothetical protein